MKDEMMVIGTPPDSGPPSKGPPPKSNKNVLKAVIFLLVVGVIYALTRDTQQSPSPKVKKTDSAPKTSPAKTKTNVTKTKVPARMEKKKIASLPPSATDKENMVKEKEVASIEKSTAVEEIPEVNEQEVISQKYVAVPDKEVETQVRDEYADENMHVVKEGENLWEIAENYKTFGDPYKWVEIYKANSNKIVNPDLIYPGQVLVIPK